MKALPAASMAAFLVISIHRLWAAEPLPTIYIDKGACPFECCTYRNWTVTADTVLFDRPGGTKATGKIVSGELVTAVTGEVHVVPMPMKVVFPHGTFRVGDTVYLVTYEGEGFYKVWFRGAFSEEDVYFNWNSFNRNLGYEGGKRVTCTRPDSECWGRLDLNQRPKSVWWILIRSPDGKEGWTMQSDHFSGEDACG